MGSHRRTWGTIRKRRYTSGRVYYQARYDVPPEAFEQYPNLPPQKSRNFSDRVQAEAWLASEKRLIDAGIWTPPDLREARESRSKVTFAEYADTYVRTRRKRNGDPLSAGTLEKYRQYLADYLNPALGGKRMTAIRPGDIVALADAMKPTKDGRGASIRWHVFELLSGIMNDACSKPMDDQGTTLLAVNPIQIKIPRPDVEHDYVIATRPQVYALADAMPAPMRLSVLLAGIMGLRQGEVLGLQRGDIDWSHSPALLRVERSAKRETVDGVSGNVLGSLKTAGSRRCLEIPEPLVPEIRAHLDAYVADGPSALLFTGIRSRGIVSGQSLRNMFSKARKAVGDPALAGMHFHDLRHSALTHYAQDGASIGQLMQQGGHTNIKTVAVYQQSSADADRRLGDAVNAELAASLAPQQPASATPDDPPADGAQAGGTPGSGDRPIEGSLVAVLASMPVRSRVQTLRTLDADRRAQVLLAMPQAAQVETMAALLEEE